MSAMARPSFAANKVTKIATSSNILEIRVSPPLSQGQNNLADSKVVSSPSSLAISLSPSRHAVANGWLCQQQPTVSSRQPQPRNTAASPGRPPSTVLRSAEQLRRRLKSCASLPFAAQAPLQRGGGDVSEKRVVVWLPGLTMLLADALLAAGAAGGGSH